MTKQTKKGQTTMAKQTKKGQTTMTNKKTLSLVKDTMEKALTQLDADLLAIYLPRIENLKDQVHNIILNSSLDENEVEELLVKFHTITMQYAVPDMQVAIDNLYIISDDDN